ncbi:hypothetical protein MRX96_012652 [Rhipicephalus microplus]
MDPGDGHRVKPRCSTERCFSAVISSHHRAHATGGAFPIPPHFREPRESRAYVNCKCEGTGVVPSNLARPGRRHVSFSFILLGYLVVGATSLREPPVPRPPDCAWLPVSLCDG